LSSTVRPTKNELTTFELSVDYNIDIPNRRIYLSEEIDEKTSDLMIKALHYLDAKPGAIEFWINCGGGSVPHMYSIYDAIRNCSNKVICVGTGRVASAATLLLVAGDEKYATAHTLFMAHEGDIIFDEGYSVSPITLAADLSADLKMEKRYCELMASHTKPTGEWWLKNAIQSKKPLWMDTDKMLKLGIIDKAWPMI
jgi:ATP-dependent protease ClpP protease subunit